ncbi:Elongation factor G C-terminus [Nakaseomyces glabratus]|nr:Elongation factor G C-terminus [Nakaseomyces glabratus]KAH7594985.1 Elongation factor G C-terminus [Nakaseomyces glabratus]KAH7611068.1 Elongation factor G C-terminus [Nakaseomyces glabratus]
MLRFVCSRFQSGIRRYATTIDRFRNIGIIAHIDAGKTTTTERMLYCAGKIKRIGDVDSGDTVTDFLPQERDRGITIQSAAISFQWHDSSRDNSPRVINLIDTPGHADFIFEVIRSLKVLDGAVLILDGVAGVEAQTEKLWRYSRNIPKICFVNKMDRVGAGFSKTLKELTYKTDRRCVVVNFPYFEQTNQSEDPVFCGVIDVINMKLLKWDTKANSPDAVTVVDLLELNDSDNAKVEAIKSRESMVEILGELDDVFVQEFFDGPSEGNSLKVSAQVLNKSIRKLTIANELTPVLAGASFKNVGIQPLLDGIIQYLPSPLEARLPEVNPKDIPVVHDPKVGALINKQNNLCVALAFKVTHDQIRGLMVFVRIYSGVLNSGNTVMNTTTGEKFRIGKLVIMQADQAQEVKSLSPGQIGVLTGATITNKVATGDTIISHSIKKDGIRSFGEKESQLKVNAIQIPPPVFSVIVEPKSLGNKKLIEDALKEITMEDPSLHVIIDEETGQTVLNGMGQLHLEIAKFRLVNEMKVPVDFGKIAVSYKETLEVPTEVVTFKDERGFHFSLSVESFEKDTINIEERSGASCFSVDNDENYLIIEGFQDRLQKSNWAYQIPIRNFVTTILSSAMASLQSAGKVGHLPLYSCAVRLKKDWDFPLDLQSPAELLSITRSLITEALQTVDVSNYTLLEPVMDAHISVPQNDIGTVMQDLCSARTATISSLDDENVSSSDKLMELESQSKHLYYPTDSTLGTAKIQDDKLKTIHAICPLKEMVTYSSKLRSLTKGRGELHMDYKGMSKVSQERIPDILQEL